MEDISTMVDNMLERVDWPATVCQVDWGESRVEASISMEGRESGDECDAVLGSHGQITSPSEDIVEIDEVRDPLDQLCFDLAPFTQTKVDSELDIEFIGTSDGSQEKHVETIDLTDRAPSSPIRTFVKEEVRDPLADILDESSDDEDDIFNNDENMMDSLYHNSDLYYTENERMVQDILDSVIDNLEEYNRRYKEKAYQSAQVLFYSEATEYIEEKPDVSHLENSEMDQLSTWDIGLDTGGKCKKNNQVDIQNMTLNYEAWSQINKIMREKEIKNKEDTGLINKRIYLEKKKFGEETDQGKISQQCQDCGEILLGAKALKEHNQSVHDVVTLKARATRYRLVDQTIEITPVREARRKREDDSGIRTPGTAKKSTTKPPRPCGSCKPCTAPDCQKCIFCLDMKKYGGPGTKKQRCLKRRCRIILQSDNQIITHPPVSIRAPSPSVTPKTSKIVSTTSSSTHQSKKSTTVYNKKRMQGSQKLPINNPTRSPISAARKHLREVENDSKPRLNTRSSLPRVKDELKARLRKKGEWCRVARIGRAASKLTSKYKKEAEQQRRTVSARKVALPSRTWPSKEELLFGFPLCDN